MGRVAAAAAPDDNNDDAASCATKSSSCCSSTVRDRGDMAAASPTVDESLARNFLELDLDPQSDPMKLFCVTTTVPSTADDTKDSGPLIKGPLIQEI